MHPLVGRVEPFGWSSLAARWSRQQPSCGRGSEGGALELMILALQSREPTTNEVPAMDLVIAPLTANQ